jgi:hypothetical protein
MLWESAVFRMPANKPGQDGNRAPITLNQRVPGSSPGAPTNFFKELWEVWCPFAGDDLLRGFNGASISARQRAKLPPVDLATVRSRPCIRIMSAARLWPAQAHVALLNCGGVAVSRIASLWALAAFAVFAPPGILQFEFSERRSSGRLEGCEIVYRQIHNDHIYKGGAVVALSGSFALLAFQNKSVAFVMKTQALDVSFKQGGIELQPVNPPIAYLLLNNAKQDGKTINTAGKEFSNFKCEHGGYCAAFIDVELIISFLQFEDFKIGYQRPEGKSDVISDFRVPGPAQKGWDDRTSFNHCAQELLSNIETN